MCVSRNDTGRGELCFVTSSRGLGSFLLIARLFALFLESSQVFLWMGAENMGEGGTLTLHCFSRKVSRLTSFHSSLVRISAMASPSWGETGKWSPAVPGRRELDSGVPSWYLQHWLLLMIHFAVPLLVGMVWEEITVDLPSPENKL